jgi:hypothetical protein
MQVHGAAGVATAVGSLPHTDGSAAADFVLELLPDLPAVPSLPRRSPAERILAHGLVGVRGIAIDEDGDVRVDVDRLDPLAAVVLDLDHDAFGGLRAFLAAAVGRQGPIKWQVVGPVTMGLALARRGAPPALAFDVAVRAVREHLRTVRQWVADALPGCPQIVVIDEPGFSGVMEPGFPSRPTPPSTSPHALRDRAAGGDGRALLRRGRWVAVAATGPTILSCPRTWRSSTWPVTSARSSTPAAGSPGAPCPPIARSPPRPTATCGTSPLWGALVQQGCDPVRLRNQALVTPACGARPSMTGPGRCPAPHERGGGAVREQSTKGVPVGV